MPYEIRNGNEIWHFKDGKWSVKQKTDNAENAKKALRLLNAIENGYDPDKAKLRSRAEETMSRYKKAKK